MTKKLSPKKLPTLRECEDAIGEGSSEWAGRCFEIASRIVSAGIVDGVAVYGHFRGKVSAKSYFGKLGRVDLNSHGWIKLSDGRVFDPTRWAFDGRRPYLHVGPLTEEYDEGGNRFRAAIAGPPPAYDDGEKIFEFTMDVLPSASFSHVEKILEPDYSEQEPGMFSESQVQWLANVAYDALQPHAAAIYKAIAHVGEVARIPIDNRRRAEREAS